MKAVKKIISYPLSIVFYFSFGMTLLIFHPLQWLALKTGGREAHRKMVDVMNLCLLRTLHVLGVTFSCTNPFELPKDHPLIIVSNHQSMFDIPLISWCMRKQKPKFISKIELGNGIPSISFNLRNGGHVLIDRKNPKQSIPALAKFGKFIAEHNFAAVIFPEGTRSKNGEVKNFAPIGIKMLCRTVPEALVVPVSIANSWKLLRFGNFPMDIGLHLNLKVHQPLKIDTDKDTIDFVENIRNSIVSSAN